MNLNKIAAGLRLIADGLDETGAVAAAPQPSNVTQGNFSHQPSTPAPAEPPPQAPLPGVPVDAPEVSADEIRTLFYELSQKHGKLDMLPVLEELGVQKVTEATPAQRVLLKQKMLEKWGDG